MLPLRWGLWWLAGAWVLVGIVVFLSLLPGLPPVAVHVSDKLGHTLAYLTLTLWFCGMYPRSRYVQVLLGLLLLGASLELIQSTLGSRSGDWLDLGANAAGIGLGIGLSLSLLGGWCQKVEGWLDRVGSGPPQ
jgi:VanZ family protein